jgi:tectonin beta-propeller repeat-containing protein 1
VIQIIIKTYSYEHGHFVQGTLWEHVPSDQLASISCGPDKRVWAVGKNGSAYWRLGITSSDPIGEFQRDTNLLEEPSASSYQV